MWRKKAAPRKPHPDPQVERQIQHVLALQRMVTSAEDQVRDYQVAITQCQTRMDRALVNHGRSPGSFGYIFENQMESILKAARGQVLRAEEGIREQRAIIRSSLREIEETADGLSEYDRAYLDLSQRE